jgi:hypothetical protein
MIVLHKNLLQKNRKRKTKREHTDYCIQIIINEDIPGPEVMTNKVMSVEESNNHY